MNEVPISTFLETCAKTANYGGPVARKKAKKSPQTFLRELATDPKKLGKFILDPEGAMQAANVSEEHRAHIKNGVAHLVHQKLIKPPEAYYVIA
jgi:hypothetical protein